MVQKNNKKKIGPKEGSKKWSNKNGPKSSPIVQGSNGVFFLTVLMHKEHAL